MGGGLFYMSDKLKIAEEGGTELLRQEALRKRIGRRLHGRGQRGSRGGRSKSSGRGGG